LFHRNAITAIVTASLFAFVGCSASAPIEGSVPTPTPAPARLSAVTIPDRTEVTQPVVSPEPVRDTHIIYSSRSGSAAHQIHRMRTDGSERVRLTDDAAHEHHWARPSPDGSQILFYKAEPGATVNDIETNSLWVMDSDGSNQRELIPAGSHGWTRQGHVEWSPDGETLLMTAGARELDIWTTDTEGTNPEQITDRRNALGDSVTAIDPSWTPDGRSIMYVGCPVENTLCWWWDQEVYIMDLGTGTETRLTFDNEADFDPYLSPDGETIVWLRCSGSFPFGPWGLYKMPADGTGEPSSLLDDGQINSNADFSHDGSTLLFTRHVIGGVAWMTAARIGVDGTGLAFVGGQPSPTGETEAVYWP
jgi:Tol biopolymer transport system component